ncbi:hypothetical protein CSB37_02905 [bacterium DOLZORAL124_38_8]|nr:MAG: hypothetical protein CSB37_02905 [bacterium DOLZORAL124_38_8]
MKQFFSGVVILTISVLFSGQVLADDLFRDFRENLGDIIKTTCHSSIDYSIDDSVGFNFLQASTKADLQCQGGKCKEYHHTINCLFNDVVAKKLASVNGQVKKVALSGDIEGRQSKEALTKEFLYPKNSQCKNAKMDGIGAAQLARGFKTQCQNFSSATAANATSLCRVAEMALLEYCGYEKFLLAKMRDKESFLKEFQSFEEITTHVPRVAKDVYKQELLNAKQALQESLLFYQEVETQYTQYIWTQSIWFHLAVLHQKITEFTTMVATFPAKFINASIN